VRDYLRFLALTCAVIAGAAFLGYLPTARLAGGEAAGVLPAMLAGCLVGFTAGALGALPIARAGASPDAKLQAGLLSMGLRFGGVLALGLAAFLSGRFARGPLLVWIGISYVLQLVVESRYAARMMMMPKVEKNATERVET
jgi:hypothetical protein